MNKEQLSEILELFKKFMPKEVSTANEKSMAMYRAYHLIKQVQPLSGDAEKDKEIERLKGLIESNYVGWFRAFYRATSTMTAREISDYETEQWQQFKTENNL